MGERKKKRKARQFFDFYGQPDWWEMFEKAFLDGEPITLSLFKPNNDKRWKVIGIGEAPEHDTTKTTVELELCDEEESYTKGFGGKTDG